MNDTSLKMTAYYDRLMMERSPQERLRMGCAMFDTAKQMVRDSIMSDNNQLLPDEIKREIFLRFYGQELTVDRRNKILKNLAVT